jgi:hypothetical protein
MKKLLLTFISSLSILSTLSFATAQVKQASQYAKIETTEAGAPMVGNATELNFVCSGAYAMVITKSYTYNNTPVEIFNMALSPNVVFEKVLPAELGTRYDLTCKTDGKVAMTDSYKTPDFLPQAINISTDRTTLNQGDTATIKAGTVNGAFNYCDVYFDSNKVTTLTGNMNTITYSLSYASMSAGSHNVYYKCSYSDNTVGTAMVNSNNLVITRNSDAATSPIDIPYCSTLDVDGDGKVQALVDGILIQRSLNSAILDSNILNGVTLSPNSIRRTAADIRAFVNSNSSKYDVDGDGRSLAGIDAVLLVRYMLGITGDSFISGVPVASGVTYDTVAANIKSNCAQGSTTMCTAIYKPVCGRARNSCDGLTPTESLACRPSPSVYTTYSNRCQLEAAGAVYVSDGACDVGTATTSLDFSVSNYSMPQSQYVIADGIKDISGMINFKTSNSAAQKIKAVTVYGLRDIISASLNGTTAPVIGYSATFNGLSISPNTNVLFSLKPVAVSANIYDGSGTGSAMPFFKDLSFTTNDNSIQTQSLVSSMLPSYSFVAGKPVIKFENWSRAGLQNGSVKVAEISIGADSGDIKINNIPFSIRKSSPFAISGYSIVDESGTAISGVNIPAYESGVDFSFSNGGYVIQSGTTKKFSIYATVSGLSGNGSYVRFMLRDKADNLFTWSDLVSNKNLLTASLLDYPTNTQTTTSGNVAIPTSCPTGTFTNSDCVCPNGQSPYPVPSGTRIQQFTCDVKGTACTDVYKPVCGQPKTCNSSLGYCLDVMQKPQTYSNICALTSAGATYLYDGTCDGAKTNLIQKSSTTPPTIPNIPNNNDVDNGDDNNTGGVCVSLTANMRFRSRDNSTGGEVSKLQNFLISSGYMTGSATGYFGNATQAAVKSYQAANGLAVSGIVGQYTRAKIVDGCSNSNSAVDEPLPLGLPDSTSTSVQPKADVITKIDMRSVSGGFVVSPVQVTNGVKMTAEFKTNDFRFDGQYYVRLMYKNSSRQCILTGSFQPIANKIYKIERTSESACVLGGNIGDLSNVDYFEIAKQ